ncbi:AGAP000358-PA-like protein [Anopheles sinensis]|uniref:AGAP000358-PA-like protein n=1 Tax=Anopheles sinensis TaxID=74873 RepID=A0A084VFS8_ANOSI|nr:AGAP000358-PA-like protein [Anopheles sinensis]
MVYISRNGTVQEARPWSLERLKDMMTGFFNFILMFFRTMLDFNQSGGSDSRDSRRGNGGDGGGPPGGGPRRRPIGRPMTLSDCTIPGGG